MLTIRPAFEGSCWYAAFSFWIIGAILFIWMHVMAAQVSRDVFKDN